ncbi:hypothetical protein SV7mr_44940 [Stieleria bergensis]|uniref:Planctomycete cytochrome C n=1 Tax=Stieleria bergensis TaxID=2528025 RepID=A0A517T0U2_9BACT|nr:hypothetical protein SV7mr_44940 [Planctomycetes bacterium SV_7m_r]
MITSSPLQPGRPRGVPGFDRSFLALLGPSLLGLAFVALAGRPTDADQPASLNAFSQTYCLDCHNESDAAGGLNLGNSDFSQLTANDLDGRQHWEQILIRLQTRQMPPPDAERPEESEYQRVSTAIARRLDQLHRQQPRIPNVDTIRRLTRTEYANVIGDLLDIQIDATQWLPKDESSHGFDNITVGELSPALIHRYVSAAEAVSRLAVGRQGGTATGWTIRLPADLTQEYHLSPLPLGTRGGLNLKHAFPETGTYRVSVRLTRDRDEKVEGLYRTHELDILIDNKRRHRFQVEKPKGRNDFTQVDANLNTDLHVTAGMHDLGVTFVHQGDSLLEIKRKPFEASYNRHRHPRQQPAIFEVTVYGPLSPGDQQTTDGSQPAATAIAKQPSTHFSSTGSRRKIFTAIPKDDSIESQQAAAETNFRNLLFKAYRRPIDDADLAVPMRLFQEALKPTVTSSDATVTAAPAQSINGTPLWQQQFERAIERGLASILVNPNFFLKIESAASDDKPAPISNFELASRLSFFLWSSGPDQRLLELAEAGKLSDRQQLAAEAKRMLADPRSEALVNNFAAQWLYLRNVDAVKPDLRLFPDFDENLRRSMRQETEWLFRHVMQNNLPVTSLIDSEFTFLNQRLATHYEIPGVVGSHFRQVQLPADSPRGGLLRHASILAVTSYSTRTSPTIRGNWILENLLGTPPPPPPPNVPTIKENQPGTATTFREQLAQHRQNEACAGCHRLMDPIGFALDHYDAIGRWRAFNLDSTIDSQGTLPDGNEVDGVADLEHALLHNPQPFVRCLVEKLLTYGLGRGVDHRDAADVRKIVQQAASTGYRFEDLITGIVTSQPFGYRTKESLH